jgi:hypothetical protein
VVIAHVRQMSGVDLTALEHSDGIERAIAALDQLRTAGLDAPPDV